MAEGGIIAAETREHWLNAERVRVYSWIIVAIFGTVLAAWVAMSLPDLVDRRGKPLDDCRDTARLARWPAATGFDGPTITAVQHGAVQPGYLVSLAPSADLSPCSGAAWIGALSGGSRGVLAGNSDALCRSGAAGVARPARLDCRRRAPGGADHLLDGQNAFLTVALAGFALLWLDRRPVVAGILIGLLALKPHLAVLFPLALVAEGRRAFVAAAALRCFGAGRQPAAFGWASWAAFFEHLPVSQAMADAGAGPGARCPSLRLRAVARGFPVGAARAAQAVTVLVAAGACGEPDVAATRRSRPRGGALMAASLLVSPYLFYYDLLWAALAVGWLALLGCATGLPWRARNPSANCRPFWLTHRRRRGRRSVQPRRRRSWSKTRSTPARDASRSRCARAGRR